MHAAEEGGGEAGERHEEGNQAGTFLIRPAPRLCVNTLVRVCRFMHFVAISPCPSSPVRLRTPSFSLQFLCPCPVPLENKKKETQKDALKEN